MSSPVPQQPYGKAGNYASEVSVQTDINAMLRFFATKALRAALSSPPLAKDVEELTFVFDRATLKLWTKVNGTLRYVQFT
jgi:hypothetical protein